MTYSDNVKLVLDILRDEVNGDVRAALEKITSDYSMTWIYKKQSGEFFPSTKTDMEAELEEVYHIKDRQYDIRNIAEGDDVVVIELIESYPNPDTGEIYRTPLVLVLEIENGKIKKGRHYCDPQLSYENLSAELIETDALKGSSSKMVIS